MSPEDTAVAEEVTGSPAAAQEGQGLPPTLASPETAVTDTEAETESLEATETVEGQPQDLDSLSDEEIAELPRVKSLLARTGESQRQRTLSEAETRRQADVSRYHVSESYVDDLTQTFKAALDEGEIKPGVLRAKLNALVTSRDEFAVNTVLGIIDNLIQPDLSVTKATANRHNQAVNAYRARRISLPDLVQVIVLTLAEQVAEAKVKPQLESGWKQQWQESQETERLRKNEQSRKQQKRPTPIVGTSPAGKGTYAERVARGDKIAPEEVDALTTNLMNRR